MDNMPPELNGSNETRQSDFNCPFWLTATTAPRSSSAFLALIWARWRPRRANRPALGRGSAVKHSLRHFAADGLSSARASRFHALQQRFALLL